MISKTKMPPLTRHKASDKDMTFEPWEVGHDLFYMYTTGTTFFSSNTNYIKYRHGEIYLCLLLWELLMKIMGEKWWLMRIQWLDIFIPRRAALENTSKKWSHKMIKDSRPKNKISQSYFFRYIKLYSQEVAIIWFVISAFFLLIGSFHHISGTLGRKIFSTWIPRFKNISKGSLYEYIPVIRSLQQINLRKSAVLYKYYPSITPHWQETTRVTFSKNRFLVSNSITKNRAILKKLIKSFIEYL